MDDHAFTILFTESGPAGQAFTLFVPCAAYSQGAEDAGELSAGESILVAGKLKWTSYTAKDGTKRTSLVVLARLVKRLASLAFLLFGLVASSVSSYRHAPPREKGAGMPALKLSKKDARKLTRALRQAQPCLLCGTFPPLYHGLFFPSKPALWGGTPGKMRVLAYALCARCFALPDKALHVEARVQADLVGPRN